MSTSLRIGTQGWNYKAWVGGFYPAGTRPADFLALYARVFNTVEVDATFYATPKPEIVRNWAARVGDGFEFALKMPMAITHERHLADAADTLAEFLASARELGPRLGPILIQMGPEFGPAGRPRLERFLPLLPTDVRFAIEFRDRAWGTPATLDLLREHGVALALVEGRWFPRATMVALAERPSAPFTYVRFMGPDRDIVDFSRLQVDRTEALDAWVPRLAALAARATEVHVYVNNHFEGHSPATVRRLQERLGLPPADPAQLAHQRELF